MKNLIECPITEADKYRVLGDLMTDMKAFLDLRTSLKLTGERADYVAALNEYIKASLFVVAREFVNIYDLAPIEH